MLRDPERIEWSRNLYPYDLLFVHRDAEREPREKRLAEIKDALIEAGSEVDALPTVCVIPVRMQEAWLLFDEAAIRRASGNPHGRQPLHLPRLSDIEDLSDPKAKLHQLLREASGLRGRRLKSIQLSVYSTRVGELISDFEPLRELPAFRALEAELASVIRNNEWKAEA